MYLAHYANTEASIARSVSIRLQAEEDARQKAMREKKEAAEAKWLAAIDFARKAEIKLYHSIMRRNGMPQRVREIVLSTAKKHGVRTSELLTKGRLRKHVAARQECYYAIRLHLGAKDASWPKIAKWFGRDHTSVIYGVSKFAHDTGVPSLTTVEWVRKSRIRQHWHEVRKQEPVSIQHPKGD